MLGWNADDSDREELRLLPKPLYRYDAKSRTDGNWIDGAVFAFVQATDPEVLLILEAIADDGRERWEYAFTRATSGGLEVRLDGEAIWKAEKHPVHDNSDDVHFTLKRPLPN